jgi:fructose-1,6-bisphosphatase/inositol monophosphatase family enzyme
MVLHLTNFTYLLQDFDQMMVKLFKQSLGKPELLAKTDFINAAGHRSRVIDLQIEDTIIDFFQEKGFPCEIEAEERGRTIISDNPKYLVIIDPLDGTTNFSKKIPLSCYGLAIAKLRKDSTDACFSDIVSASVRSFHTNEFYTSNLGKGSQLNGKMIKSSNIKKLEHSLVAFDMDRLWKKTAILDKVLKVLSRARGTRRFGANLLDMCYVASGKVELMIDIRNSLSAVHTPGLFIAKESGAIIHSMKNKIFNPKLLANEKMSFVLCSNEVLFEQVFQLLS